MDLGSTRIWFSFCVLILVTIDLLLLVLISACYIIAEELAAVVSVLTCVYTENTSFSFSAGASTLIGYMIPFLLFKRLPDRWFPSML